MAFNSMIQGLQVVDQNEIIIGLPPMRDLVETVSPLWFSIPTSGSVCAGRLDARPSARIIRNNFFMTVFIRFVNYVQVHRTSSQAQVSE